MTNSYINIKKNSDLVTVILLNYKDYCTTIISANIFLTYNGIDKIIIVDNHSENDSYTELRREYETSDKVDIIKTNANLGYAKGNNFGVQYAIDKSYNNDLLIANPDTTITRDNFEIFLDTFFRLKKQNPNKMGALAPKIDNVIVKPINIVNLKNDLLSNFMVATKIYNLFNRKKEKEKIFESEMIHGSFFCIPLTTFIDVGMFDEDTFLYCEERILAFKLKSKGYFSFFLR